MHLDIAPLCFIEIQKIMVVSVKSFQCHSRFKALIAKVSGKASIWFVVFLCQSVTRKYWLHCKGFSRDPVLGICTKILASILNLIKMGQKRKTP
jgi:hypothetical protein